MYINFYKQRKRFIILVLNDSLRKKCPNTYFSGPYFDTFYAVNFLLVQTIFVKSVIINH